MFHDHHLAAAAAELDAVIASTGHNGGPASAPVPEVAPEPVRSKRSFRCLPDSYFHSKAAILRRCVEEICSKGLEPQDIKPRSASWRRELHTRLLREEWPNFGLDRALILAEACRLTVELRIS